ncbi:TPA_asm: hypothetical protein [ssRNA phage SRR7976310_3]|uniref:Uncharacterized protein n=1 Tax=ssRNA phage SRR7976310_3 TaxID=2786681 RepID=A0A8S5L4S3_9VIRU|nr:hypothetical protein QIN28_gp4 [ssRNA phage SRR7976310_3]DAD52702.1 TPA_asm: hypothetical protein [ssRNA phage SRR7976310_3]
MWKIHRLLRQIVRFAGNFLKNCPLWLRERIRDLLSRMLEKVENLATNPTSQDLRQTLIDCLLLGLIILMTINSYMIYIGLAS